MEYLENHFILGNLINPIFINKSFFLSQLQILLSWGFHITFVPFVNLQLFSSSLIREVFSNHRITVAPTLCNNSLPPVFLKFSPIYVYVHLYKYIEKLELPLAHDVLSQRKSSS